MTKEKFYEVWNELLKNDWWENYENITYIYDRIAKKKKIDNLSFVHKHIFNFFNFIRENREVINEIILEEEKNAIKEGKK